MNADILKALPKVEIPDLAKRLNKPDIQFLVKTLIEKDDSIRFNAFLLLKANSKEFPYTYEFWNDFESKMESSNSYQRSLGLMLIAENVRWDKDNKFDKTLEKYLGCCSDEKFITARQAIQGLANILESTDNYDQQIGQFLSQLTFAQYKDNQRKLLDKDKANVIKMIENKSKTKSELFRR